MKTFAVNALLKNVPAKRVAENVGAEFLLCGFYTENIVFKDGKNGECTTVFGDAQGDPCAFNSFSRIFTETMQKICLVYGEPEKWEGGIPVRIRMNTVDGAQLYGLEVF
jgi:hypothetical protein